MKNTSLDDAETPVLFGFFAPGTRLMGNLQFGAKALLICLVFLMPIVWLTWSFYSTKTSSMAFSAKELLGVRYNREIFPVINAAQQWRRDATAMAANGVTPATLAEVQTKLRQAHDKLAAIDQELGAAPRSRTRWPGRKRRTRRSISSSLKTLRAGEPCALAALVKASGRLYGFFGF